MKFLKTWQKMMSEIFKDIGFVQQMFYKKSLYGAISMQLKFNYSGMNWTNQTKILMWYKGNTNLNAIKYPLLNFWRKSHW